MLLSKYSMDIQNTQCFLVQEHYDTSEIVIRMFPRYKKPYIKKLYTDYVNCIVRKDAFLKKQEILAFEIFAVSQERGRPASWHTSPYRKSRPNLYSIFIQESKRILK